MPLPTGPIIPMTRKESAELTRKRIVESAFAIVGESGYAALTSNALIQHAGIAKGTLYHHFTSLEDVIFAMIDQLVQDMLASVPVQQFDSMQDYLEALGEYDRTMLREHPELINVIYGFIPKGMKDPKYQKLAQKHIKGALGQIAPSIRQFYDNRISEEQIDHAIRIIDMFCIGFCVHNKIIEDEETYMKIWADFSRMLIDFLDRMAEQQ